MLIDLVVRRAVLGLLLFVLGTCAVFAQSGPSVLPSQFEFTGSWGPRSEEHTSELQSPC